MNLLNPTDNRRRETLRLALFVHFYCLCVPINLFCFFFPTRFGSESRLFQISDTLQYILVITKYGHSVDIDCLFASINKHECCARRYLRPHNSRRRRYLETAATRKTEGRESTAPRDSRASRSSRYARRVYHLHLWFIHQLALLLSMVQRYHLEEPIHLSLSWLGV